MYWLHFILNLNNMELIVSRVTLKDYDKFCEWWKFWRFPAPPLDFLPNNGLGGLKVSIKSKGTDPIDICAGYLYETNSKVAWLEFIVSNPNIKDKKTRHEAIVYLIRHLTVDAEMKGYEYVFASLKNENLINKYKEVGYQLSSSNTTEVVIKLI